MTIHLDALSNPTHLPPQKLLPWLIYTQPLTQKLRAIAGDASLEVLSQSWESSDDWDEKILNVSSQKVLHREIVMRAHGVPCWYARTILPFKTYDDNTALFDRLKQETLGDLIFNGTDIKRLSISHFMIDKQSMAYDWLTKEMQKTEEIFWARISEFSVKNTSSFFLLEILLPGLLRYCP